MGKVWRICLSGISRDERQAYRKNLKWLIAEETVEAAVQTAMKHATDKSNMVQVVIWSAEFIGDLVVPDKIA